MRCRYQMAVNVCPAEVLTDRPDDLYCPHHRRVVKAKEVSGITVSPARTNRPIKLDFEDEMAKDD